MFNRKECAKQYYIDNKDEISKRHRKYYETNREKILERTKEYHISNREKRLKEQKEYYLKNRERILEKDKQWREKNPNYMKEYNKIWYKNNRGKKIKQQKEYNGNHIEKIKKYHKEYEKDKRKVDLKYKLASKISRTIRKSLKGNKDGKHWEDIVGYNLMKLIKHLKETIPKDYIWQDFLEGKLHIDHKIPISAFNYTKPEHTDFKRCWALDNLRLLPAKENLIKGSKLDKPFQPALQLS